MRSFQVPAHVRACVKKLNEWREGSFMTGHGGPRVESGMGRVSLGVGHALFCMFIS